MQFPHSAPFNDGTLPETAEIGTSGCELSDEGAKEINMQTLNQRKPEASSSSTTSASKRAPARTEADEIQEVEEVEPAGTRAYDDDRLDSSCTPGLKEHAVLRRG